MLKVGREYNGEDYYIHERQKDLKILQNLLQSILDLPNRFKKKEEIKRFEMTLRFEIGDLKDSLYGEQTELTIPLRDKDFEKEK